MSSQSLRVVLFNQTYVAILAYGLYHFVYKYPNTLNIRELPSIQQIVFDLALFFVLEEIIFYYGHRLLHYGALYRYIHKKHYEWTSPIAVVAHYCHPIKHRYIGEYLPHCFVFECGSYASCNWLDILW